MGDEFGSDRVPGCCLWSLGDHRQQTEMYYVGCAKTKKTEPKPMSSPNN